MSNILMTLAMVLAGTLSFALLDYFWLAKVMKQIYISGYGGHVSVVDGSIAVNILPAFIFYVFASIMIIYFAVNGHSTHKEVVIQGALLGLFGYGLYNLTLAAVLPDYPWKMVLIDMSWGVVATAIVAVLMYSVSLLFS